MTVENLELITLVTANSKLMRECVRLAIMRRRSCRKFSEAPVSRSAIDTIMEAGLWAPTGSNHQNVYFLPIDSAQRMTELGKFKAPKSVVAQATGGVLVLADSAVPLTKGEEHIWEHLWTQNAAAAIQNMLLTATAHGIASCWISFLDVMDGTRLLSGEKWRNLFPEYDIPESMYVFGLVALGYAAEEDASGFPKGDESHGANPIERRPLVDRVIKPKET